MMRWKDWWGDEKGTINGSFQTEEKHRVWMISQGRAYKMDSTFLSWKHSKGNVYGWMEHITIHIWNKGEKTNANSHTTWIPQIRAASLINSCQTVQCSAEMFLPHNSPTFSVTLPLLTNDLQLQ